MNWTIERAELGDAAEILALQKLAYQSEAERYDDHTLPPLQQTPEGMEADLRAQTVLKATDDGRIVGSVRGRVTDGTCHVGRLIVHPDLQNRGLGTQLLSELERACPDVERFELFTGHLSAPALHIYRKLGYQVFRKEYVHERLTLVYLEKQAPSAQGQRPGGGR